MSRAALASLRRGVGKPPGSIPEIWQFTLPDTLGGSLWGDRRETAVHIALTHWALHQQATSSPMHQPGRRFGTALRLLASLAGRDKPQDTPAYRRMMALASNRTLTGITTHARGLITQLRRGAIGFDYGRWADDLELLQIPGRATDVQRRWGRDFYRIRDTALDDELASLTADSDTSTDTTQGE